MTDYRTGKWGTVILTAQRKDGTWGTMFHGLAQSDKAPLTTEQALRRLHALGFTIGDEPIRRCVDSMAACLRGERKIDAYWEKGIDWAMYEPLMLAAWIRHFDPDQPDALAYAHRWAKVAEAAFALGYLDESAWNTAYEAEFHHKARHPRPIGFTAFYHAMLLPGVLSPEAESSMVQHILEHGMYYVYDKPLMHPPATFASKETSYWLAALELLAEYPCAKEKLAFATAYLYLSIGPDGQWDLSAKANDKVYFPLSDNWRAEVARKADCTERIRRFLDKITRGGTPMFRELTRKNKAATREECIRLLENEKRGVLSVQGDDGYPYGMPMNHWYDESNGCLYFHCGHGGHREEALCRCDKVSYCVYDKGYTEPGDWVKHVTSVIVFGRMEIIDDMDEIVRVATALTRRFTLDEKYLQFELEHFAHETLLLKLTPEHICGKHVTES